MMVCYAFVPFHNQLEATYSPAGPSRGGLRPGTLKALHAMRDQSHKEMEDTFKYLNSIKTGCWSVSDPELGISESPLGDATMLPVIPSEHIEYLDCQEKNWIGYSPTHYGFQIMQEAYQRGEWSKTLRIKDISALEKHYRNAKAHDKRCKDEASKPSFTGNLASATAESSTRKSPEANASSTGRLSWP